MRAAPLGWEVFVRAAVAGSWLQARASRGKVWVLCVCGGILTAGLLGWIHPKADHVLQGSSLAGVHPNALFILKRYPKSI